MPLPPNPVPIHARCLLLVDRPRMLDHCSDGSIAEGARFASYFGGIDMRKMLEQAARCLVAAHVTASLYFQHIQTVVKVYPGKLTPQTMAASVDMGLPRSRERQR